MATSPMIYPPYRRALPQSAAAIDPNANPALTPPDGSDQTGGNLYSDAGPAGTTGNPIYGNTSNSAPALNTDPNAPIHDMFYNDQSIIQGGAQQINNEATSQLGYYAPIQQQYQQAQDTALEQLNQTPGYTPGEAGQININYGQNQTSPEALQQQFQTGAEQQNAYLTPDEQQSIFGNPSAPEQTMQAGTAAEGAMLNAYQGNIGGELTGYQQNLSGELGNLDTGVGTAVGGLQGGLSAAQGKFGKLDTAVNNPALAFDPNSTEKQLTDADVQQMKTAAGTRIGNQYQSAEDTLQRNAAAAGNASPLAIAAANARLQTQEAADQGDAETNADIAAKQTQYTRAAGIEGQREGAVQTQAGMQAGAATTEEGAAQNAAALAGTQDIAASETTGQAGINAANTYGQAALGEINQYGQASLNTTNNMANQNYNAAEAADVNSSNRATTIAGNRQATEQGLAQNRQATQTGVNATQFNQANTTAQETSTGAQTVGNARIAGQGAYRSGVAGQQQLAQQGGQAAVGQQQAALGTLTSGLNQSTANRATYENTGPGGLGKMGGQLLGAGLGAVGLAEGGVVTEPEVHRIAEKGPELVVPLGRFKPRSRDMNGIERERMAA